MNTPGVVAGAVARARGLAFNAILLRELRSSGRRRSTYLIRGGYAGLFSLVTLLAVGTLLPGLEYESQTARSQTLAAFAESLVLFVAWFQFVMIMLVSPAMTSPAICDEKRLGTLSALMTTPLSAMQIVAGKLAARMYQVMVLVLVSAPMLLAVRVFGGVPLETILAFTCVTLAAALMGGAMGLLFSVWHTKAAPAAIFAILTLGMLSLLPPIVYFVLNQTNTLGLGRLLGITPGQVNALAPLGYAASPPIALFALTMDGPQRLNLPWLAGTWLDRIWVASALIQLVGAGVLVVLAGSVLRRLLLAEARGAQARPERVGEAGRARRRLRRLGGRPIFWREVGRPWLESRFQFGVLAVVLVVCFGYAYWRTDLSEEPMHLIMGLGGLGVVVLLASVQTTGAISGERDAQTWDTLMTTPVSPWRVILDKYSASAVRLWPLVGCAAAHFGYSAIAGHMSWLGAAMVVMLLAAAPMLYLATGLLLSMVFRRGAAASIANIGLVLCVWVGLPVMAMIWHELSDSFRGRGDALRAVVHGTSPMGLIGSIVTGDVAMNWGRRTRSFTLGGGHIERGTMLAVVAGLAGVHLILAAGALAGARGLFGRCSGRTS